MPEISEVSTRVHLKYTDVDGDVGYLEHTEIREDRVVDQNFGTSLDDAMDLGHLGETQLQAVILHAKRNYCQEDDLSLVEVTERPIEAMGEYKELVQMVALGKLTESEVRALGLEKTAVYIKLRHHNVEDA